MKLRAQIAALKPSQKKKRQKLKKKISEHNNAIKTLNKEIAAKTKIIAKLQAKAKMPLAIISTAQSQNAAHNTDLETPNAQREGSGSVASLYYLHADHLGKTQFATDTAGAVIWDGGITTPFGERLG